jgi:hypothetical protein
MKQEVVDYWLNVLEGKGYRVLAYQRTWKNYYDENIEFSQIEYPKKYDEMRYEKVKEIDKLYQMIYLVRDRNGYLFTANLSTLLNEDLSHFYVYPYGFFENKFTINNINTFIKIKNRPYFASTDNIFMGSSDWMIFHCNECDKDFYCTWSDMQKYLKNKKHSCNASYHRTNKGYLEHVRHLNPLKKDGVLLSNFVPEQESFYDSQYENTESPIASQLKKYCVENYQAIPEYYECLNPNTGYFLPYDIFIPAYDLYIEVQGGQHYDISEIYGTDYDDLSKQQERDVIKKHHAEHYGTFVEIDLRQIKTIEEAISHVESFIQ